MTTQGSAVNIDDFLRSEGFDSEEALHEGRVALERDGLTRPGKTGFVAGKLPRARDVLERDVLRVCDGCRPVAPHDHRLQVEVTQPHCQLCRGSNNRRAVAISTAALARRRVRHVLVVGGTPAQHHDLRGLFAGASVELRFVDGTQTSHSTKEAELNKRWAQLVVVWGPTPLRHSVSNKYTEEVYPGLKVITVPRRGIEALCAEITRALR
jgi:hypothetical protein